MRLVLCEKPSQARDIARNLKAITRCNGYLEGNGYQVSWCLGHLLELAPPEHYNPDIKPWRLEKLPIIPQKWEWLVREKTKKQFTVIKSLLKKTDHVIVATDPDREGQAIADEVLEKCQYKGKTDRLWLSALDDASIQKALKNIKPNSEMKGLYQAARARMASDWLLGMNNTMAVTSLYGKNGVLSVGRVQTPTLRLVVDRDYLIENFKPQDYFVLKARFLDKNTKKHFWTTWQAPELVINENGYCLDKHLVEGIAAKIKGEPGVVQSFKETKKNQKAPICFSLSTLQKKASSAFGYSAKRTLEIAQSLYETHKATSYPRTDSGYLPEEQFQEAGAVLDALMKADSQLKQIINHCDLKFRSPVWNTKKVTAHHGIIPTLNKHVDIKQMSEDEFRLYDLIRRQYLAQFLGDYAYLHQQIEVLCAGEVFSATGHTPIKSGWKQAFDRHILNENNNDEDNKNKSYEKEIDTTEAIPILSKADTLENQDTKVEAKQTKPPARFTEGTLIEAMKTVGKFVEDAELKKILKNSSGIGTEATRANILETLFKRGYLDRKSKQVISTEKGRALIDLVPEIMKSPVLTAQWEEQFERIIEGKSDFELFVSNQAILLSEMLEKLTVGGQEANKKTGGQWG